MSDENDPFKDQPRRWAGRYVTFDAPGARPAAADEGRPNAGKESPPVRLSGTVTSHNYAGRTKRGNIPDYTLTIVGKSGKTLTVSMVESHASFPE